MRSLIVASLCLVAAGATAAYAGERVEFTPEEARFLAHLAAQEKQIDVMKAVLRVVDAADQPWPTGPADLVEFLVKKSVEAAFDAPGVDQAIKSLDRIKCLKTSEQVQLFVQGKHPEVKGRPSARNKKFFEKLAACYAGKG